MESLLRIQEDICSNSKFLLLLYLNIESKAKTNGVCIKRAPLYVFSKSLCCVCALQFMKDLLSYLDHWRSSVKKRIGPFSTTERKQMLLSDITQNGMRMTSMLIKLLLCIIHMQNIVSSFLELIPVLFKIPGVTCFLTEKLSQDPIEKFFGCQRQMGKTNDNPKIHEFMSNTQSLRVIDSINVQQITGNCRGTKRKHYDLESVDLHKPIKKRKRHASK